VWFPEIYHEETDDIYKDVCRRIFTEALEIKIGIKVGNNINIHQNRIA
jgi:hypothetical protein